MKKTNLVAISFAFVAAVAQLDEMFRSFWAHCDYAYEEKHEAFFEVCKDENMDENLMMLEHDAKL